MKIRTNEAVHESLVSHVGYGKKSLLYLVMLTYPGELEVKIIGGILSYIHALCKRAAKVLCDKYHIFMCFHK